MTKRLLFVCGGNTCRSPMAKTILEQMLKERGLDKQIIVDSAAKYCSRDKTATKEARELIRQLYRVQQLSHGKVPTKSVTRNPLQN